MAEPNALLLRSNLKQLKLPTMPAGYEKLAREAAGRGAQYALSPEVTVLFPENRDDLRVAAGPWERNPHIARVAAILRESGRWPAARFF